MSEFRKKPVVVEAEQFDPDSARPLPFASRRACAFDGTRWYVITAHGQETTIEKDDWIVAEPDGRGFYPCKPDIFAATYELAGAAFTPRPAGEAGKEVTVSRLLLLGVESLLRDAGCTATADLVLAALQPPSGTGGRAGDFGEPWIENAPGDIWHGVGAGGQIGVFTFDKMGTRAVACVNALAGMNPAAVQAVIDAARRCVPKDETVHLVDLWGRLDALRAALDALASLSTGGDAEGGKDARV